MGLVICQIDWPSVALDRLDWKCLVFALASPSCLDVGRRQPGNALRPVCRMGFAGAKNGPYVVGQCLRAKFRFAMATNLCMGAGVLGPGCLGPLGALTGRFLAEFYRSGCAHAWHAFAFVVAHQNEDKRPRIGARK